MSTRPASMTGNTRDVTLRLARYSAGLRYEDLDDAAHTVGRHCIMDWLGVAVAGAADDTTGLIRAEALEQGGNPQASIVGGPMSSVLQAALVNGTAGHALDFDDVHSAMRGHATAAVAPAVLAIAERQGISGAETLTAFIAGVEVACRVGQFVTAGHYEHGWHATGTVGTFGAAAGAARVLGLDAQQSAMAFGIAGTQAAGLKSMFGTMCKPMHAGKAASAGLHAALLAARGFVSRVDVLECPQGFGATQAPGVDVDAALDGLGGPALVRNTLFKYHAACYGTHASIEAARSLVTSQDVDPARIARIEVRINPRYLKMCDISTPRTGLEAKFSLRMTCAMALAGVATDDPGRYDEDLCHMPLLGRLVQRTTVTGDDDFGNATSELIVSLDDGVVYRVRGDVSTPDSDRERQGRRLVQKFDTLVTPLLGAADAPELRGMLEDLHQQHDIRALMALTRRA